MDVELRQFRASDADSFHRYSYNEKLLRNMRDGFPATIEQCRDMVKGFADNEEITQCVRAVVINGEAVGCIGLFLADADNAEIAYWIGEPFWRKGIMSTGIRKFCEYAIPKYKLKRIFAKPYSSNIASKKALEKAGFQYVKTVAEGVCKDAKMTDYCEYMLDAAWI